MVRKFEAVKALIYRGDEYLFVESKNFKGGKYEIPGGRRKGGESDKETLIREIKEEVGLVVEIVEFLNKWHLNLPAVDMVLNGKTYLCRYISGDISLGDEQNSFRWVSSSELVNLDVPVWLRDAFECLK